MKTIDTIEDLRAHLIGQSRIVFVPTMGFLHEGHLSLIRLAKQYGSPVVVSIFVNPLQFGQNEDLADYPRDFKRDQELLEKEGVYILFAPKVAEMYPTEEGFTIQPPPQLNRILEGEFRPVFFTGVATIVLKLFACVQPRVAIFGKKDYQQQRIISAMCHQLALPTQIIAAETFRAPDGLALASRNAYLNTAERAEAPTLYKLLMQMKARVEKTPNLEPYMLEQWQQEALEYLQQRGWQCDYFRFCCQHNLLPPTAQDCTKNMVILVAAKIGKTRLIDNIEVFLEKASP